MDWMTVIWIICVITAFFLLFYLWFCYPTPFIINDKKTIRRGRK